MEGRYIAFFHAIAANGYEIDDIVSQIFVPRKDWGKAKWTAFDRLYRLANAGDKSTLRFAQYVHGHLSAEVARDFP